MYALMVLPVSLFLTVCTCMIFHSLYNTGTWSITASLRWVGVKTELVTTWTFLLLFPKWLRIGNKKSVRFRVVICSWTPNIVTTWTCVHLVIPTLTGTGSVGSVKSIGWLWTVSTCHWLLSGILLCYCVNCSQEYIFYQVYKKLGLSDEGIMKHFTGLHFQVCFSVSWWIALEPYG